MTFKTSLLAASAALILAPAASFAADYPVTVQVQAIIPAADGLQISPVNGWDAIPQNMTWDIPTQDLRPIQQQIAMRSSASIEAYLTHDAKLTNGSNELPLIVRVHGKTLAVGIAGKEEILTDVEAAAGRTVEFHVSTTKPAAPGYVAGTYAGQVTMMFESATP